VGGRFNGLPVDLPITMKRFLIPLVGFLPLASFSQAGSERPARALRSTEQEITPEKPIMKVVLVHGFLERGNAYKTLRKRLAKKNISCLTIRLTPCDARDGLEALAQQMKQQIEEAYGTKEPISVIGFSMGGLVSRYYLQNLGGAGRCQQLITISSPHSGTYMAKCYPSKGAIQMRPGSQFLKQLEATENQLGDMPIVSYRTPLDLMILPSSSSTWQRASNRAYPVLMHPLMLSNPFVLQDVEKQLLKMQNSNKTSSGS